MSNFTHASSGNPCQLCGGKSSCSVLHGDRNELYFCHRRHHGDYVPDFEYIKESRDGTWGLYKLDGAEIDLASLDATPDASASTRADRRWRAQRQQTTAPDAWTMEKHIAKGAVSLEEVASEGLADELADSLGLPPDVLHLLPVRFLLNDTYNRSAWVFPEYDGTGSLSCHVLRYDDGTKKAHGPRGLTLPISWDRGTGPLFIPEGASDTLALQAMNLAAVGRPNATGGIEQLTALLVTWPADRPIIVLGENDRKMKDDGTESWPGREGAEHVARELAQRLDRIVFVALPPGATKDVRDWFKNEAKNDPAHEGTGRRFQAACLATVITFGTSTATIASLPAAAGTDGTTTSGGRFSSVYAEFAAPMTPEEEAQQHEGRRRRDEEAAAYKPPERLRCPNPNCVFHVHKSKPLARAMYHPCRRLACDVCRAAKKDQWKATVRHHLNKLPAGARLYAFHCLATDWKRYHAQILRRRGLFFRLDVNAEGTLCYVVCTVSVTADASAEEMTAQEAARSLCSRIDSLGGFRKSKVFTHSRKWPLLEEPSDATGQWASLGKLPNDPDRLRATLQEDYGTRASPKEKRYYRWWQWWAWQFNTHNIDADALYRRLCRSGLDADLEEEIGPTPRGCHRIKANTWVLLL